MIKLTERKRSASLVARRHRDGLRRPRPLVLAGSPGVVPLRNKQNPLLSGVARSTFPRQCSTLEGVTTICDITSTLGESKGRAKALA
jgi:hypothetical protein